MRSPYQKQQNPIYELLKQATEIYIGAEVSHNGRCSKEVLRGYAAGLITSAHIANKVKNYTSEEIVEQVMELMKDILRENKRREEEEEE